MIILALDQATRTSGWSVFQDKELIAHGTFTFTNANMGMRLYQIRQKVKELVDQYKPNKLVFEDIQLQDGYMNNVDTFKKLAEVFGVIYELASELKLENDSVLSSVWRKGLGIAGKRRDEYKPNTQKWVIDTFDIRAVEDEADAIAIGAYAAGIRCKKQKIDKAPAFDWS